MLFGANALSPPHSGFWDGHRVRAQRQQWGIWHQNENPNLHFNLDGSCLRGKLGLPDRPSLSCVEDSDALTWQWNWFSGLDQWSHHHLLLLLRDGPIEVTFLSVHSLGKKPYPQGNSQNEAKGTGSFSPSGWDRVGERMIPPICISIKDDLWRRENLETYTYNGKQWEADMVKSTHTEIDLALLHASCVTFGMLLISVLNVLICKMGIRDKISISLFVW